MIENLFPTQIWKSSLNIDLSVKDKIFKSIKENYQRYESYLNPHWNCRVHSTFFEHNNIDYSDLIPYFKEEYEKFTQAIDLKPHSYMIGTLWYNCYLKGYNQEIHDHIESDTKCEFDVIYSAVYFLKLHQEHPRITFYNYTNYNTYYSSNVNVKKLYSQNNINHSIISSHFDLNVKENDFIIFPSYIPHGVLMQKIDEPRITISTNFHLTNNGSSY